jgi:hypothetical protein
VITILLVQRVDTLEQHNMGPGHMDAVAEKRASCFKFSSLSNGFSKFPQLFACD